MSSSSIGAKWMTEALPDTSSSSEHPRPWACISFPAAVRVLVRAYGESWLTVAVVFTTYKDSIASPFPSPPSADKVGVCTVLWLRPESLRPSIGTKASTTYNAPRFYPIIGSSFSAQETAFSSILVYYEINKIKFKLFINYF